MPTTCSRLNKINRTLNRKSSLRSIWDMQMSRQASRSASGCIIKSAFWRKLRAGVLFTNGQRRANLLVPPSSNTQTRRSGSSFSAQFRKPTTVNNAHGAAAQPHEFVVFSQNPVEHFQSAQQFMMHVLVVFFYSFYVVQPVHLFVLIALSQCF